MKYLTLIACIFILQACTLNLGITDTHGLAEKVGDDEVKADNDFKATIPLTH